MGLATGPGTPSTFMVAKDIIKNYNSFVLSLFSVGMGMGQMFFQQACGSLLDLIESKENFLGFDKSEAAYIVSYAFLTPCLISFLVFVISIFVYRRYIHLLN
jgi:hypothetical protein